jgi:hypothetical protein
MDPKIARELHCKSSASVQGSRFKGNVQGPRRRPSAVLALLRRGWIQAEFIQEIPWVLHLEGPSPLNGEHLIFVFEVRKPTYLSIIALDCLEAQTAQWSRPNPPNGCWDK